MKKLEVMFSFEYGLCSYHPDCEGKCRNVYIKKDEAGFVSTNQFYKTGFTKVSQLLAFQLMPNLDVDIVNSKNCVSNCKYYDRPIRKKSQKTHKGYLKIRINPDYEPKL